MKPQRPDQVRQIEVQHPRLNPSNAFLEINVDNAVHPRRHDHHRRADRHRAARQAGTRTTWDEWPAVLAAHEHDRADLLGGRREAHHSRRITPLVGGVGAIEAALGTADGDPIAAKHRPQVVNQRCVAVLGSG